MKELKELIKTRCDESDNKLGFITELRELLHELSPIQQPIDLVQWVPLDMVEPNDYNPNSVAKTEMSLLYKSIKHDGYTQPIVTIYDENKKKYVIVDGFHRFFVCKTQKDIQEINKGMLPIVVIKKDINERMAATIRHNRARGEHSVSGMSNMVFELLSNGWTDSEVCDHLGMEAEELLKLKHITGFSKLFQDTKYKKAWETNRMIKLRLDYQSGHPKVDEDKS